MPSHQLRNCRTLCSIGFRESFALPRCRAAAILRFRLSVLPHIHDSAPLLLTLWRFRRFCNSTSCASTLQKICARFARSVQCVQLVPHFTPRAIFTHCTRARFLRLASACIPHALLVRSARVTLRCFTALCTVTTIHTRYRAFSARGERFKACALTWTFRLEHVRTPPILSTFQHCTRSTHAHHLSRPRVLPPRTTRPSHSLAAARDVLTTPLEFLTV